MGTYYFTGNGLLVAPVFLTGQWERVNFATFDDNTFPGTARGPRFIRLFSSVGGHCQGGPQGLLKPLASEEVFGLRGLGTEALFLQKQK